MAVKREKFAIARSRRSPPVFLNGDGNLPPSRPARQREQQDDQRRRSFVRTCHNRNLPAKRSSPKHAPSTTRSPDTSGPEEAQQRVHYHTHTHISTLTHIRDRTGSFEQVLYEQRGVPIVGATGKPRTENHARYRATSKRTDDGLQTDFALLATSCATFSHPSHCTKLRCSAA